MMKMLVTRCSIRNQEYERLQVKLGQEYYYLKSCRELERGRRCTGCQGSGYPYHENQRYQW